jgi:O-antigen/teichoic acid export membrane protein
MQAVSVAGLAGAAVHKLISSHENHLGELRLVSHARIALIPVIFVTGGLGVTFMPGIADLNVFVLIAFLTGYALGSFDVGDLSWTSRGGFTTIAGRRMVLILTASPAKFWFAYIGDLEATMLVMAVETALWQIVVIPGSGMNRTFVTAFTLELRTALRQVWRLRALWGSSIVSAIAQRIDLFIVTALLGVLATGQYSTASRPIEATIVVATSLITVLFNPIVRASKAPVNYALSAARASKSVFWTSTAIASVMAFGGPYILVLLYGESFRTAAEVLPIYAASIIFLFQRQLISRFLIIEHLYGLSLASNVATICVNIILNFALIPPMGLSGSAIAAVATHPVSLCLSFLPHPRGRRILVLAYAGIFAPPHRLNGTTRFLIDNRKDA